MAPHTAQPIGAAGPRVRAVRHAGIVVRDMERAVRFYRDRLGMRVVWDREESGPALALASGLAGVCVRTVKLAPPAPDGAADTLIELLEYRSPAAVDGGAASALNAIGLSHLALTVTQLDGLYQRLRSDGVPCTAAPQGSADGRVRLLFCRDPDGTSLELVEPLGEPPA